MLFPHYVVNKNMQQLKADVQARSTRDSYDLEEKYLSTSIRAIKDVAAYVPLLAKLKNLKRVPYHTQLSCHFAKTKSHICPARS